MWKALAACAVLITSACATADITHAQTQQQSAAPADVEATLAAQRAAMERINHYHGVWQGQSVTYRPDGTQVRGNVTHRVGPFLDNTIKVMEGLNVNDSGQTVFNGMIIVFYDVASQTYNARSFARGATREFPITMTPDGYYFDVDEGGGVYRRIAITVNNTAWSEIVTRHRPGGATERVFDMNLTRTANTTWPAAR